LTTDASTGIVWVWQRKTSSSSHARCSLSPRPSTRRRACRWFGNSPTSWRWPTQSSTDSASSRRAGSPFKSQKPGFSAKPITRARGKARRQGPCAGWQAKPRPPPARGASQRGTPRLSRRGRAHSSPLPLALLGLAGVLRLCLGPLLPLMIVYQFGHPLSTTIASVSPGIVIDFEARVWYYDLSRRGSRQGACRLEAARLCGAPGLSASQVVQARRSTQSSGPRSGGKVVSASRTPQSRPGPLPSPLLLPWSQVRP